MERRTNRTFFSDHRAVCAIFAIEVDVKSLNKGRFRKRRKKRRHSVVDSSRRLLTTNKRVCVASASASLFLKFGALAEIWFQGFVR
ncbi:hypothetical protein Bca101_061296 [Brassica carinata]